MRGNRESGDGSLGAIAEQVEKVAAQIRWLAYQLREAGVAEDGLPFAIDTLGRERVKREVEAGPPFGVRCRGRAAFAADPDEAAAWTILSACSPEAVSRRVGGGSNARRRRRGGRRDRRVARPKVARSAA
jgi:hypothetical protein